MFYSRKMAVLLWSFIEKILAGKNWVTNMEEPTSIRLTRSIRFITKAFILIKSSQFGISLKGIESW